MTMKPLTSITPEQLQEYLLCPNRFYFRYVAGVPVSLPALPWLDRCLHRSLLDTLRQQESTQACLERFEESFHHPLNPDGTKRTIDWGEDTPDKLYLKGRGILQLYLATPLFQELDPLLVDVTVPYPICLDHEKKKVYPLSLLLEKEGKLTIPCHIDALLRDGTMLDIRLSSRVLTDDFLAGELRGDLSSIAPMYLPGASLQPEQVIRYDLLIRTKQPKVQRIYLHKRYQDAFRALSYLYPILSAIQQELFYPTPNIHCANHCPFVTVCHRQFAPVSPVGNWRSRYRDIFLVYLTSASPVPAAGPLPVGCR
jgi:hypothetical protein